MPTIKNPMQNFIGIEKFGIFFDPKTKLTCPMFADGTPDANPMAMTNIEDSCMKEELIEEINNVLLFTCNMM